MQYSITPLLQTDSSVIHNQNPIHGDKLGITHPQMWIRFPQSGKQHEWWHVATIEVGCLPIPKTFSQFPSALPSLAPTGVVTFQPNARAWGINASVDGSLRSLKDAGASFPHAVCYRTLGKG